ncbi:site-specific DNA-methyltransferase [Leptolyngbyaceae cyanobacterium CCMR0082]|uniref:Methyltransferase n=2 Tax=Adonisia turfae TaxID=2950184 RepID=A0A6M0S5P3_9CYAN|nr:site-specific DNA-methyltransferase [Adonisia turfae]MDV3350450.1 site-specific DNA-methyltransferase [Leptothoe sp. LEGE 181152]NEZ59676.1 site-specific DNA-methyltransferase [Adonisia turfae CCMR0081]NEZ63301.1 site-specific DNA-methyltransferase [Adonisia turfae CCMR0082]
MNGDKKRAPNNRTLVLSAEDHRRYRQQLVNLTKPIANLPFENITIWQDAFTALPLLPNNFVNLLIVDPPYNRSKVFNQSTFAHRSLQDYETWLDSWMSQLIRLLKPDASAYICCDWQSSPAVYSVFSRYFIVRSRITWEREKGRGSKQNWKNSSEDIWFGTLSEDYWFDVEAVKLKRRVLAPYRDRNGNPKDWQTTGQGKIRITHPSNLWTDISIPFWSMPENTDHPTQKPEKLIAKLILASSQPGDMVFDPFLGSGTTSVVAKKLDRRYVGIELDEDYACIAEKRLEIANTQRNIQGYAGGYFWERNSLSSQQQARRQQKS